MRILHLFEGLKRGGAERMIVSTLRYLNKNRFPSVVCCLHSIDKENTFYRELTDMGVKSCSLNMNSINLSFVSLIKLVKLIKRERIDIVHTHTFGANIYGRIAGKMAGARHIISTLHNLDYEPYFTFKSRFAFERRRFLDRSTGNLCNDSFIAVSSAVKRSAEKFLGFKDINVIYNSIDINQFKPLTEKERILSRDRLDIRHNTILLTTVARLDPQKGHTFLFCALNNERLKNKSIRLLVIGKGTLEDGLKKEVRELGLEDKVVFLGVREDIREIVGCSDIFILPSIYEGFGIVLLEAMALKIPCVASSVDGIKEIITDKKDGILVRPSSSLELSEGISRLIDDPYERVRIAEAGYMNVHERFDIECQIKLLEKAYSFDKK